MLSSFDLEVGARTLAVEARGEPPEGQEAVAWEMRNRVQDGCWGRSLSSVCLWNRHIPAGGQGFQYSGWRGEDKNFSYACDLEDGDPVLLNMRALLARVMAAPQTDDPTNGAMWHYAETMDAPTWTQGAIPCGKFGAQYFFKGVK